MRHSAPMSLAYSVDIIIIYEYQSLRMRDAKFIYKTRMVYVARK